MEDGGLPVLLVLLVLVLLLGTHIVVLLVLLGVLQDCCSQHVVLLTAKRSKCVS